MEARVTIRRGLEFLLVIPLLVVAADALLKEWPSNLSDAVWWQRLPWVLLAVFWIVILFLVWRERYRRGD